MSGNLSPNIVTVASELLVLVAALAVGARRAWKIVGPILHRLEVAAEEAKREAASAKDEAVLAKHQVTAINAAVNNVPDGTPPLTARMSALETQTTMQAAALRSLSQTVSGSMQDLNESMSRLGDSVAALQRLVLNQPRRTSDDQQ